MTVVKCPCFVKDEFLRHCPLKYLFFCLFCFWKVRGHRGERPCHPPHLGLCHGLQPREGVLEAQEGQLLWIMTAYMGYPIQAESRVGGSVEMRTDHEYYHAHLKRTWDVLIPIQRRVGLVGPNTFGLCVSQCTVSSHLVLMWKFLR